MPKAGVVVAVDICAVPGDTDDVVGLIVVIIGDRLVIISIVTVAAISAVVVVVVTGKVAIDEVFRILLLTIVVGVDVVVILLEYYCH